MTIATVDGADLLRQRIEAHRELPPPAARRALREARGISVTELAESVGVTSQCVRQWEAGVRTPRGDLLRRYVEALRVLRDAP